MNASGDGCGSAESCWHSLTSLSGASQRPETTRARRPRLERMPVACSVAAGLLPALRFARLTTKRPVLSTPPSITGSVSAAISSVVVKLLREYTGRGPTKARTYVDDDLITVVLRDTLTMGER